LRQPTAASVPRVRAGKVTRIEQYFERAALAGLGLQE
jgi:hypothetical protein